MKLEDMGEIDEWILQYRRGELSVEDRVKLIRWLEAAPENLKLFQELLRTEQRVSAAERWKVLDGMEERVWNRIVPVLESRRSQLYVWGMRVAAIIIVLVGVFFVWDEQRRSEKKMEPIAATLQVGSGTSQAILVTCSGEKIELTGGKQQIIDMSGVNVILDSTGKGVCFKDRGDSEEREIEMSTIVIPEKGEYSIVLSDGTKVWMNSDSRLEFPNFFRGESREVKLEGEAYFEVKSDLEKPFCVHVGDAKIRVLGTAFNVMAYKEEGYTEVALLRGKVSFDVEENAYELTPGEIATLNQESGQTTVRKGDVMAVVDWTTGRFNFEDMPLEKLAMKLSRWYGVSFVFEDEVAKKLRFSGVVTKYRTLDYILKMISKTTDVTFGQKEGKVIVLLKK